MGPWERYAWRGPDGAAATGARRREVPTGARFRMTASTVRAGGRCSPGRGRERETPRVAEVPRKRGNMTDERSERIGSVTPEPTCTECRGAGSLWREPCYVRLGIMDGTAALAQVGESAS